MPSSIISTCCTCVVSLVVRVISDAVLKRSNWCTEKCATRGRTRGRAPRGRSRWRPSRRSNCPPPRNGAGDATSSIRPPICENRARIALHDAVIDDVGHQAREIEVGQRLRQRQHRDDRERRAKRFEKANSFNMSVSDPALRGVREFAQALDAPSENLTAEPSRECREAPFRDQYIGAPKGAPYDLTPARPCRYWRHFGISTTCVARVLELDVRRNVPLLSAAAAAAPP